MSLREVPQYCASPNRALEWNMPRRAPLFPPMAAGKLSLYQAKRDFTKTAEPSGKARIKPAEYPRFVIQKHAATRLHYDLRLEVDGVFESWAVTKGPSLDPHDRRLAVEVEDHPLDYGDFEGTIPQGEYGGGTVMLWDRGFWAPEDAADPRQALRKGELKFVLAGEKLKGGWVLVRMRRNERDRRSPWKNQGLLELPGLDSNQDKENQNLLCYRYTTGYSWRLFVVSCYSFDLCVNSLIRHLWAPLGGLGSVGQPFVRI